MPSCTCPIDAWPALPPAKGIVFSPGKSYHGAKPFCIPCGRCISCRLGVAADWATRAAQEAQLHDANSFITLTFDDAHLPKGNTVSRRDLQSFLKRLRERLPKGTRIRFLGCGEYGRLRQRAHYHLCLFGWDFRPDRIPARTAQSGEAQFSSALLSAVWPFGEALISDFTYRTAAYVASYTTKKLYGPMAAAAYTVEILDDTTGETATFHREPPFLCMSRMPGLGAPWFNKYKSDIFPSEFCIIDGKKRRMPQYYLRLLLEEEHADLLRKRKSAAFAKIAADTEKAEFDPNFRAPHQATRLLDRHNYMTVHDQRRRQSYEDEI